MDDQRIDRDGGAHLTARISIVLVLVGVVMAWPIYDQCYFAMANLGDGQQILFLLLIPITLAMRFVGAIVVGVGLFLPIKRPWLGAVFGFAVQILVTLAIYFTGPPD